VPTPAAVAPTSAATDHTATRLTTRLPSTGTPATHRRDHDLVATTAALLLATLLSWTP
jgi:hypothetical protein